VLLAILLGCIVQALAQQAPFVPNPERFGRRADRGKLSFCVDQRDADWPVAQAIGTAADLVLIQYLRTLTAGNRWQRIPLSSNEAALNAVANGTVAAALVWAPALWALQREDPQLARNLHVLPSTSPLPVTTIGIGAALLSEQSFLQNSLDQAITSLVADGTIAGILEEFDFPAQAAR
jgi:polar amino acid transport system substrate-binding protein